MLVVTKQLAMSANTIDLALLQEYHTMEVIPSSHTVADRHNRHPLQTSQDCLVNQIFIFGVQASCGFVQQQQFRLY